MFKLDFSKQEIRFFSYTLAFYCLLYFIFNNKSLFLLFFLFGIFLFWQLKNLKKTQILWLLLVSAMPFYLGKTFSFVLIPPPLARIFWFTISPADAIFFFLFFLILKEEILRWKKKKKVVWRPEEGLIFLFLLAGLISTIFAPHHGVAYLSFLKLVRYTAIYFLAKKFLKSEALLRITFYGLLAGVIFESGWAIAQILHQAPLGRYIEEVSSYMPYGKVAVEERSLYRISGTTLQPNRLASFLAILLPFVFSQLFSPAFFVKNRSLFFLALILSLIALVATFSRAAWLVVFGMITFLIFLFLRKKTIKLSTPAKRLFLFLILLGVWLIPVIVIPRLNSLMMAFGKYGAGVVRINLFKEAISLIYQRPFTGVGLEAFVPAMLKNDVTGVVHYFPAPVHNIFLLIASEMGVPVLLFFLLIVLFSFKKFWYQSKNLAPGEFTFYWGIAGGVISFLLLMSWYSFGMKFLFDYFWLLLALLNLKSKKI